MTAIEYDSGFDFIDVVNDLDGDYVKFMCTSIDSRYCFDIDENNVIHVNLPMDDHDGVVRKVGALGIKKNIILPRKLNYLGNVTNSNGKMIRFKRTLEDCTIVNRQLDDEFEIVGKRIDMEGFFNRSFFYWF